ncbi:MAG: hypothetical protein FJZ38_19435 [Candidatus Rokubacteria bacterium]|nr:hypothetical protein [Candidatus Rokubacteria bacterium]
MRHPERVPRTGSVLLCINHPNNLIDSLVGGAAVPRKVHYLATATLFRNPPLGSFLRSMGVIPVYRRQDDPAKMDKNVQTVRRVLRRARRRAPRRDLPGRNHARRGARAAHQDRRGADRARLRGQAPGAAHDDPGRPHLRGAARVPRPRARVVR